MVPKTSSYKSIKYLLIHYMVRLEYRLILSVTNTLEILHVDKYDSNTVEFSSIYASVFTLHILLKYNAYFIFSKIVLARRVNQIFFKAQLIVNRDEGKRVSAEGDSREQVEGQRIQPQT